jgi:hypothetical protein
MASQTTSTDVDYQKTRREIFAETGHRTLNALLIVSGGAAVTFLTFLGSALGALAEHGDAQVVGEGSIRGFVLALQMYVSSVTCCITAQGVTYLGQAAYHFYKDKLGFKLMVLSAVISVISILAFVVGSVAAISAFGDAAIALTKKAVGR